MDHLPGSTLRAEVMDSCPWPSDKNEEKAPGKLQKHHAKWDKRDLNSSFTVGDLCELDSTEGTLLNPVKEEEKK